MFEGAKEKHEEMAYPESESALEKEGPSERQEECFSQVVLWSLRPTSCTVVHMSIGSDGWSTERTRALGHLAPQ